ncbi:CaiB/BaiF CoA transferase family protein [Chloroflexota bacterium]
MQGIRILDFTRVLAGPYATRLLADFGAEVIKVQPRLPAERADRFARGYENAWNRNKLGITLNLSKPEGISLARRLVALSDAVVENFTPRVMANWGLDYDNLKEIKPGLIMVSLSAMGQDGPQRDYAGFGPTVQAFSGMTHLTSFPGSPSLDLGFSYADHVAGLFASLALLGALEHRRKTGKGQYIDLSETEAMAGLLGSSILDYTLNGVEPVPVGNSSRQAAPHGVFRCQGNDRWCAIAVFHDEEWQHFKQAMGNPAWVEEEKFATHKARQDNRDELYQLVSTWTGQNTAEEVMHTLQRYGVPAGAVQNAVDLAVDPQLKSRNFFIELAHPETGRTISDAVPVRLSQTPAAYRRTAPVSGQDNDYVYRRLLGISKEEMAELARKGVI